MKPSTRWMKVGLIAAVAGAISVPVAATQMRSSTPTDSASAPNQQQAALDTPRFRVHPSAMDYYGAIATSPEGGWGAAWDYSTRAGAEESALQRCGANCSVKVWVRNACGAVASNNNRWAWAVDSSAEGAKQRAIAVLGGGQAGHVCTTR